MCTVLFNKLMVSLGARLETRVEHCCLLNSEKKAVSTYQCSPGEKTASEVRDIQKVGS